MKKNALEQEARELNKEFEIVRHNCGYWIKQNNPTMKNKEITTRLMDMALKEAYEPTNGGSDLSTRVTVATLVAFLEVMTKETLDSYGDLDEEKIDQICNEYNIDKTRIIAREFCKMAIPLYLNEIKEQKLIFENNCA